MKKLDKEKLIGKKIIVKKYATKVNINPPGQFEVNYRKIEYRDYPEPKEVMIVGFTCLCEGNLHRGNDDSSFECTKRIPVVKVASGLFGNIEYVPMSEINSENYPTIVCLCGSTRFSDAFRTANLKETLKGNIVLSIGCDFKSDDALGLTENDKVRLDELHLRKIDLADEVLILNVDGYIGQSTSNELKYAKSKNKKIRYLENERK